MDQQKPAQESAVSEAFGRKFTELAVLWAVVYTIAVRIGPEIPETAGGLSVLLQTAVAAPVMAALRMTCRNSEMSAAARMGCRILYIVMAASIVIMAAMAFRQ